MSTGVQLALGDFSTTIQEATVSIRLEGAREAIKRRVPILFHSDTSSLSVGCPTLARCLREGGFVDVDKLSGGRDKTED